MKRRLSVAMTADMDARLRNHLLRRDGQEDVCLATYANSTGTERATAVLRDVLLPEPGDREVHGNASFTGDYVVRAATAAAQDGLGVAIVHSHPCGSGWQYMSPEDADAERSFAYLAHALTGRPLVGMTLAGVDGTWSARRWSEHGETTHAESVRVLGAHLAMSWNDALRPAPDPQESQIRTISAWGQTVQASVARLRVLVVGAGSVGLDVAIRCAATGIVRVAVMDFDDVEVLNLDRLPGAVPLDVLLRRGKAEHALRELRAAATAQVPDMKAYEQSICEDAGIALALDYDVIFCCVDRPWPRAVLNQIAYSDLVPIIDGGIAIGLFTIEGVVGV